MPTASWSWESAAATGKAVDYAKVERDIAAAVANVERAAHGGLLAGLDVDAKRVVIGGEIYTRVGRCEGAYHTLAGSIRVLRSLYRQNGKRNAKVVDAISLRAGIVADGWLPADRARDGAPGPARNCARSCGERGRDREARVLAVQLRARRARRRRNLRGNATSTSTTR